MSIYEASPSPWTGRALSVLRIAAGLMFITFGTQKVLNFPPLPEGMPPIELMSQAGIGGLMEMIGGVLILIGLFTRHVSFILSGEMAVAYWQFHAPMSIFPSVNQGVPAALYAFVFLYLAFAGAGPWSIDAMLARRKR